LWGYSDLRKKNRVKLLVPGIRRESRAFLVSGSWIDYPLLIWPVCVESANIRLQPWAAHRDVKAIIPKGEANPDFALEA
jgi:hypothetical protein